MHSYYDRLWDDYEAELHFSKQPVRPRTFPFSAVNCYLKHQHGIFCVEPLIQSFSIVRYEGSRSKWWKDRRAHLMVVFVEILPDLGILRQHREATSITISLLFKEPEDCLTSTSISWSLMEGGLPSAIAKSLSK